MASPWIQVPVSRTTRTDCLPGVWAAVIGLLLFFSIPGFSASTRGKILGVYDVPSEPGYGSRLFLSDEGFAVFRNGYENKVLVLDMNSGSESSTFSIPDKVSVESYDDNLKMVFACNTEHLFAYDLNGNLLWEQDFTQSHRCDLNVSFDRDSWRLGVFQWDRVTFLEPATGEKIDVHRLPNTERGWAWYGQFFSGSSVFDYWLASDSTLFAHSVSSNRLVYAYFPKDHETRYPHREYSDSSEFTPDGKHVVWTFGNAVDNDWHYMTSVYSWPGLQFKGDFRPKDSTVNFVSNDHITTYFVNSDKEWLRLENYGLDGGLKWQTSNIAVGYYTAKVGLSPGGRYAAIWTEKYSSMGEKIIFMDLDR